MPTIKTIKQAIALLKINQFPITTINIIKAMEGGYFIDFNTPPAYSRNARFGKYLHKNCANLGIRYVCSTKIQVANSKTTTAVWA